MDFAKRLYALNPVWRKRRSSGRVVCPDPGPSVAVADVAEGAEVAEAMLVEQLGPEAKEGDGDDAEDCDNDRQWQRHAIAFPDKG